MKKNILVVNQHGENRGDEAAMRAMIREVGSHFPDSHFTLIVQFQDTSLHFSFDESVSLLHMKMPYTSLAGLMLYTLLKAVHINMSMLLNSYTQKIINSYENADIVISAPGGPYIGDIYYKHEFLHWLFIYLGYLYKKPLLLYATSCGPFSIKPMNLIRRHIYGKFSILCVREAISKLYLERLIGKEKPIYLSADSALQDNILPYQRENYFCGKKNNYKDRFIVSVSANNYSFPGESNPQELKEIYKKTLIDIIVYLSKKRLAYFMFFPQLYGQSHSDVPFLKSLGEDLPKSIDWEIVDPFLDSDMQRRIMGMANFYISSRYHPQIFAVSHGIPGICFYYEHKMKGFMNSLGFEDHCFDIRHLCAEKIEITVDLILSDTDKISSTIKKNVNELVAKSKLTSRLAADLLTHDQG